MKTNMDSLGQMIDRATELSNELSALLASINVERRRILDKWCSSQECAKSGGGFVGYDTIAHGEEVESMDMGVEYDAQD